MTRSERSMRVLADQMAELMSSAGGIKLARLLKWASAGDLSPKPATNVEHDVAEHIGIWQRKKEQGRVVFTRDPGKMNEWRHWANIGKIPSKGHKTRVLLLGESVARGYLYDPNYTPASTLADILSKQLGHNSVEVIDLARTTMAYEIATVARAALMLEPDFVVMFCGNNWRCECPIPSRDLPHLSAQVAQYGIPVLKWFAEQNVKQQAERTVNEISSFYAAQKIPLLWIIPEFNLVDWSDPVANAPHLVGYSNGKWLILKRTAETALAQGNLTACAEAASEMIALDQGTTACGYYLLAKSLLNCGKISEAREYLTFARDACIWDTSTIYTPRIFSVTQDVIRSEASKANTAIVDCPNLFAEYFTNSLPDRKLFLDYCHLTSTGIRLTMAATAARILNLVAKRDVDLVQLFTEAPSPSNEIESEAHFLAAVHNAHWWQGAEIVQYHASKAVHQSQHLKPILLAYVDLQARCAPALMCKAAEIVMAGGSAQIQHYLLRYNSQQLDELLIASLVRALSEVGDDIQADVARLQLDAHAFPGNIIDMLDCYYNSSSRQAQEMAWVTPLLASFVPCERHYFRAFAQESCFQFIAEGDSVVMLSLTYRNPAGAAAEEQVLAYINGEYLGSLVNSTEWTKYEIQVPHALVRRGINRVTVRWPMLIAPGDRGIREVANDLLGGRTITAYPTFGDIYNFDAHLWEIKKDGDWTPKMIEKN